MQFLLPDAGLLFWMLLSFGVVFFILRKYGFPVITASLEERKKFIDESVENARKANEKLALVEAQSEAMLKEAQEEQMKVMREVRSLREQLIAEARKNAEDEGRKIIEETQRIIAQEKEEALRDIRRQVALVSVEVAEKALRRELSSDARQQSVIEELINESLKQKS